MSHVSTWVAGMPRLDQKKHRHIKGCRSVALSALAVLVATTALSPASLAQVAAGSWTTLPSMSTARYGLAATTGSDGRIYAIGGYQNRAGIVGTAEVYDPTTN